jgi:hypothetical protein
MAWDIHGLRQRPQPTTLYNLPGELELRRRLASVQTLRRWSAAKIDAPPPLQSKNISDLSKDM